MPKIYSQAIVSRWGDPLLDEGYATVSHIFLNYYHKIEGLRDIDALFIIKVTSAPQGKWLKDNDLNMICSKDTFIGIRKRLKKLKNEQGEELVEIKSYYTRNDDSGKINGAGTIYNFKKLWDEIYKYYEAEIIVDALMYIVGIFPTLPRWEKPTWDNPEKNNSEEPRSEKPEAEGKNPKQEGISVEQEGISVEQGGISVEQGGKTPLINKKKNKKKDKKKNEKSTQNKKYKYTFRFGHIDYYFYDTTIFLGAIKNSRTLTPQETLAWLKEAYGEEYRKTQPAQEIKKHYGL